MASGLARALGDATLADEPTGDYKPGAILVTGGAGFIASHVVLRLVEGGHKVRGRGRGGGGERSKKCVSARTRPPRLRTRSACPHPAHPPTGSSNVLP